MSRHFMPEKFIPKPWDSSSIFKIYGLLFLLVVFYYFVQFPIIALDTDLWYHLSGGRFFFANHSIPQKTFFSFLDPPREYVNYYWLFQVLVFKIYSLSDYYGLILLRTVIFSALGLLIMRFLMEGPGEERPYFYWTVIFICYTIFLLPRFQLIRPHIFTYFFIVAFLYLFELHPKKIFLLPLLVILWANLHGITYHILLLILTAYSAEMLIHHFQEREKGKTPSLWPMVPIIISFGAVYLTPHGSQLFAVPLISTDLATNYINELQPTQWQEIFSLQFNILGATPPTLWHLLQILAFITFGWALWKRRIRIAHFLLFVGGTFLFFMGVRFQYEFILLALPLFRAHPLDLSFLKIRKEIGIFFMIAIFAWPIWVMSQYFKNPAHYPFTTKGLPEGAVTFLNAISAQGKVMNHPNLGGYLQWKLYPKYRILMDMQVPFVFHDQDFHLASQVWGNAEVLRKTISQHEPTFILAYHTAKDFKGLIEKFPQYRLVFFDHEGILYIHEGHYPEIARTYEIRHIDPYGVLGKNVDEMFGRENKVRFLEELSRVHKVDPEELMANQLLALVYLKEGEFQKALFHANAIIRNFPEIPTGYRLKGDGLKAMKKVDEAIQNYHKALDRSEETSKAEIYKKIGYAYGEKGDHKKTHRFLKKGILVFAPKTTYQEVYDLSLAAFLSGNYNEAHSLLLFAGQKVPPEDREFQEKIRDQLSKFVPRSAG